ncbi:MAG: SRPBCC family protein [bacterium]|nr:SRPBCC family protein [bacterium]
MTLSVLHKRIWINAPLGEVWSFFSNPYNLKKITPPEMGFEITNQPSIPIRNGMHIHYQVKPIFGIPLTWVSEITQVIEMEQFADIQIVGPYRYWHHLHRFYETPEGVLMEDIVHYALPFGWFTGAIRKFLVQPKLENIFQYREQSIQSIFQVPKKNT